MAPIKKTREPAKNREKNARRKRPQGSEMFYKCIGQLCGEECDQEIQPASDVSKRREAKHRDPLAENIEMDSLPNYFIEDDLEGGRDSRNLPKSGRIVKAKQKNSKEQFTEMPLKIGVEKAIRYICEALDFGVQSGYLMPKDQKGKVLRVSSDLLLAGEQSSKARMMQRIATASADSSERRLTRKRQRQALEMMEEAGTETEAKEGSRHRRSKKQRSRSRNRGGRRRGAKSRSRSKSRRRHGKRRIDRSRSIIREGESRPKVAKTEGGEEHDDMVENSQETSASNRTGNTDDNDDGKSAKSTKSVKSSPNSDSQTTNEEKEIEHDADDDNSDIDYEDEKKK